MNRRSFIQSLSFAGFVPELLRQQLQANMSLLTSDDALLCSRKFERAVSAKLQKRPIKEVIIEIGKTFLGTTYVANTLEVPGEERLVVNLRGLDCVTFYENSLVLARCVKKSKKTFDDYKAELQFIRYRGGIINGYPSRLHYTSDYIYDNEKKGVWKDVAKDIGIPFVKTINFMSAHPDSYRQVKENPEFAKIIAEQEREITKREKFYIPKNYIDKIANKIESGDILGVTTDLEGLDVSHTGIAIWHKSKLRFLHAPNVGHKVAITEKTLAEYVAGNKQQTGIMVARPLEPR